MNLDLFSQPRARRSDPATSKRAAASMHSAAHAQRAVILEALTTHGAATADELDVRCGFRPTTSGRRCREMVRAGLITITPDTRPTRSGRQAHIYKAAA